MYVSVTAMEARKLLVRLHRTLEIEELVVEMFLIKKIIYLYLPLFILYYHIILDTEISILLSIFSYSNHIIIRLT